MRHQRAFLALGLAVMVAGAAATAVWLGRESTPPAPAVTAGETHAGHDRSAAHLHGGASEASGAPAAPVVRSTPPPGPAPAGMVWVPGGTFWMGCDGCGMPDAEPVHVVTIDGFWMDETPVTNAAFDRFVRETGYVTVAERPLNPRDFPGVPAAALVPGSVVFVPPAAVRSLHNPGQWWQYVPGATWRHPEGPESTVRRREEHPVVHVAWEDAVAYLQWADKELPTEAQYEFAARGGLDRQPYAWGNELRPDGRPAANIWQGSFPVSNSAEDGYAGTSPVMAFPPNGFGLHDMGGNVWHWCADWYRPDSYRSAPAAGRHNPAGPPDSFDPAEPGVPKRVQRGGSFLCSEEYCVRYLVGSRGKGAADTGSSNVGFRGVRNVR
jgi:formylglycine-generating enzyme